MKLSFTSWFTKSIRRQLMISIALIHAVMMTLFVIDLVSKENKFLQNQMLKNLKSLSNTIAINSRQAVLSNDIIGLEEIITSVKSYPNVRYAMILDIQGKVLAHTDSSKLGYFTSDKLSTKLLRTDKKDQLLNNDSLSIDYAYPIFVDKEFLGWVRISFDKHQLLHSTNTVYLEGFFYTLLAILVGLFIAFFMSKGLTHSLIHLKNVIHSTMHGKRQMRALITRNDEVGHLAQEFNLMLETLENRENDLNQSQSKLEQLNISLEDRVEQKTKELMQLNEHLEERIDKEVQKNKNQIQTMIIQERHAQLGEMVSMIAHQWRQPLSAIAILTSTLRVRTELISLESKEEQIAFTTSVQKKMIDIEALTKNLTETIDTFRDFYKPQKNMTLCFPEQLINQSLEILEGSLKTLDIKVTVDNQSLCQISISLNEMMQVIINIIKNASDNFIEKKVAEPEIDITARDSQEYVEILISDNGGGLPLNVLEKIFDPYFTTKEELNGTGLGLYMSKTIIQEHHHGHLIASNYKNGLCFTIQLPKKT